MADKNRGWVLLYRSVRDGWIWEQKPFSFGQAWIDLILDVNHEDKKLFVNGKLIKIKRGQKWTSIRVLAARWGWRQEKVLQYIKALEQDGMITRKATRSGTLLTIVNYGKYQDHGNTKDNSSTTRRTTQKKHGDNETKNYKRMTKEGKKEETLPPEGNQQSEEEDLSAWEALEDDDAVEH
jgi:DNA replication protein DnaD